jgi:ribosomal protein L11 methyltransferase
VLEIVIDPGQAFGTGTHPTTALCLELMLDLKQRGSFADLGCGSGVLAIAAAKLGYGPITAVDAERQATEATLRNARDNGVALDVIDRADLRNAPAPKADVVAANLMRPLLLRVAEQWEGDPPPALILSGLLDHEADEVAAAFAPLTERKRLSNLGWSALLLA